jgi:hypothetical protein
MSDINFNNIPIPSDLDNLIESSVTKAQKHKGRVRFKASMTIISSAIILVVTLGVFNPALAAKLPIVKNVFKAIEKNVFNSGNYSKYATEVKKTASDKDISVTLSEVLCDGETLYVTYSINSKTPFKNIKAYYKPDIDLSKEFPVDTSRMLVGHSDYSLNFTKKKPDIGSEEMEGYFVDDYNFVGMKKYDLTLLDEKIPDEFNFYVELNCIADGLEGKPITINGVERSTLKFFEGNWKFNVPVKVNRALTRTIQVKDVEYNGIKVESIVITPFETKIKTTHPEGTQYGIVAMKNDIFELHPIGQSYSPTSYVYIFKAPPKDSDSIMIKLYAYKLLPNGAIQSKEALRKTVKIR